MEQERIKELIQKAKEKGMVFAIEDIRYCPNCGDYLDMNRENGEIIYHCQECYPNIPAFKIDDRGVMVAINEFKKGSCNE